MNYLLNSKNTAVKLIALFLIACSPLVYEQGDQSFKCPDGSPRAVFEYWAEANRTEAWVNVFSCIHPESRSDRILMAGMSIGYTEMNMNQEKEFWKIMRKHGLVKNDFDGNLYDLYRISADTEKIKELGAKDIKISSRVFSELMDFLYKVVKPDPQQCEILELNTKNDSATGWYRCSYHSGGGRDQLEFRKYNGAWYMVRPQK